MGDIVERMILAVSRDQGPHFPYLLISEARSEIAELRSRCEKAEAELKYESDRGDEWFEKATYEVGGAPQLWSDRATAAESRCEELVKALEPFADEAGCYDPDTGDGDDTCWAAPAYFKIRDLRRARDVISSFRKGSEADGK
ncbi:hypothetical protein HLI01_22475 [Rhizobium laguerreae]|uniref:hypothetical protein n=1 Tax=Rhizobium laguerreae TaxID=1076926 RepID=UPI001478F46C|nr:hypothetical protein [Rhizobium laguerreae]NNH59504.1 hypothetical protein [Rhizobium laguerreae]